jgi:hypothetical protein
MIAVNREYWINGREQPMSGFPALGIRRHNKNGLYEISHSASIFSEILSAIKAIYSCEGRKVWKFEHQKSLL